MTSASPTLLTLALLSTGTASAATDLLRGLLSDGVFTQTRPLGASQLQKGERGYELLPGQFGGEWSVVLGGSEAVSGAAANTVRFAFLGGKGALGSSGPTIGKLLGRMAGRAAGGCFNIGSERLPALQSWIAGAVSAGQTANLERSFGAMRAQLLLNVTGGTAANPSGSAAVDLLLSRSGTPGAAGWASSCLKGQG